MSFSKVSRLVWALPVILAVLSASPAQAMFGKSTATPWSDTPPAVQATIGTYLGLGEVGEIVKQGKADGEAVYDATINMPNGQKLQLEIKSGGQLTEFKYRNRFFRDDVPLATVPMSVMAMFRSFAEGAAVGKVAKENKDGHTLYETRVTTADHHVVKMKVAEDGKLVELETSRDLFWLPSIYRTK